MIGQALPPDDFNLDTIQRIHLIGIGGIGVSAVARLLMARGHIVTGSDVRESCITQALRAEGAIVTIGHAAKNVEGANVVVVSTAIPDTNPELGAARERGIPVVHRSKVLQALMKGRVSIGVTGTNGKGTVSAMIAFLLDAAGKTPSFAIGGMLTDFGTNAREGKGRHLVCELDESDGSFTNTWPTRMVVVNLEADHLNYYKDLDGLLSRFSDYFASEQSPRYLHVNGDDPNLTTVLARSKRTAVTFGERPGCTYRLLETVSEGMGARFHLVGPSGDLGWFSLSLPGRYNVHNAAAALSVVIEEGLDVETIRTALPRFCGIENRFTLVSAGNLTVVKDYTSHPTGIRGVIDGARTFSKGRIVAVFKPYRFTMIHYLQNEYTTAFHGADLAVVTEMYTAGEVPIANVDTPWLVDKIRSAGSEVIYVPRIDDIQTALLDRVVDGDTVVFFGGDDLFRVADEFVAEVAMRTRGQANP